MQLQELFQRIPIVETERLMLRRITYQDIEDIYDLYIHPDIARYNARKPLEDRSEAWQYIRQMEEQYDKQHQVRWGIMLKSARKLIGDCIFFKVDMENDHGRLGYNLHPVYQGEGYMSEAVHGILGELFANYQLQRAEAVCLPENKRSIRLLAKKGFVKEGELRHYVLHNGQFQDVWLFGITREEFQKESATAGS